MNSFDKIFFTSTLMLFYYKTCLSIIRASIDKVNPLFFCILTISVYLGLSFIIYYILFYLSIFEDAIRSFYLYFIFTIYVFSLSEMLKTIFNIPEINILE